MSNDRKLFKFYKSYFDVMNELPEKDQLPFIKAILEKQFYNREPELKGIVKLAYISQKHSIDRQVQGYIDKTERPILDPMQGGAVGGAVDPSIQLKEEVKEEVKKEVQTKSTDFDFDLFLKFLNVTLKKNHRIISDKVKNAYKARLKQGYTKDDIKQAIINASKDTFHKENDYKYLTPEFFSRPDKLEKFISFKPNKPKIHL